MQSVVTKTNEDLFQEYLELKDPRILDNITIKNKYYIRTLANSVYKTYIVAAFNGCVIGIDDLEQEGFLGFRKGLERYNLDSGYKVITYCKQWALKYMREFYGKNEKTVKMPDSIRRIVLNPDKVDIDPSSFKAMMVSSFSEPTLDIENIENTTHLAKKDSTWYDYYRLITSEFSDAELSILNTLWDNGSVKSKSNIHVKNLITKIKYLYEIISCQAAFVAPLLRRSEYVMDLETYNFWINGYCGDDFYKYKAIDVFLIEKDRLGFEIYNKKDFIILKL